MSKKKEEEKFEMLSFEEAHSRIMANELVAYYEVFKNPLRWTVVTENDHSLVLKEPDKTYGDECGVILKDWAGNGLLPDDNSKTPRGSFGYGAARGVFGPDAITAMSNVVVRLERHEAKRQETKKRAEAEKERYREMLEKLAKEDPKLAEELKKHDYWRI